MPIDMDKILGSKPSVPPYENDQPKRLNIQNQGLHRFPPLATADGINPEFQAFFDDIVCSIILRDYTILYRLSDKVLKVEDFTHTVESQWGDHWEGFYQSPENGRGLDIELNMERFEEPHRNIVGGFRIVTYHLNVSNDEFQPEGKNVQVTEFVKAATELLFTYRVNKGFEIISRIQPFTREEI